MAARKVPNFCEAALSVSYNRRFLWNDFVELTTLLGFFFLFWTDAFCGRFQMQTTLLLLGNLQITPNQWIYSPSVLSKSIATWTYLILYSYQIKLQYIQMHLFQLCTLRDVHFLPSKPSRCRTLNIANPVFAAVFGVPAYVSDDRWPGEGCWDPLRHVTRGQIPQIPLSQWWKTRWRFGGGSSIIETKTTLKEHVTLLMRK